MCLAAPILINFLTQNLKVLAPFLWKSLEFYEFPASVYLQKNLVFSLLSNFATEI